MQTIEYKNFVIVIFVCSNGLLNVYGKQENETNLSFFHSIATRSTSDINLFSQNGDVYMILASGAGLDSGPSACDGTCVFLWTGVHFDKIYEVVNVKTVGLASFPSSDGRIIVALQKTVLTLSTNFLTSLISLLEPCICLRFQWQKVAYNSNFKNRESYSSDFLQIGKERLHRNSRWTAL